MAASESVKVSILILLINSSISICKYYIFFQPSWVRFIQEHFCTPFKEAYIYTKWQQRRHQDYDVNFPQWWKQAKQQLFIYTSIFLNVIVLSFSAFFANGALYKLRKKRKTMRRSSFSSVFGYGPVLEILPKVEKFSK